MKELLKILVKDDRVRELFEELTNSRSCYIRTYGNERNSVTVGYDEYIRGAYNNASYKVSVYFYVYEDFPRESVITFTIEDIRLNHKAVYRSIPITEIKSIDQTALVLIAEYVNEQCWKFEQQKLLLKEKLK